MKIETEFLPQILISLQPDVIDLFFFKQRFLLEHRIPLYLYGLALEPSFVWSFRYKNHPPQLGRSFLQFYPIPAINIGDNSVQGFMSYDLTSKQSKIQTEITTSYIFNSKDVNCILVVSSRGGTELRGTQRMRIWIVKKRRIWVSK